MTTEQRITRLVRNFRAVGRRIRDEHIAAARAAVGEGCNNDPLRNVWCTCCP